MIDRLHVALVGEPGAGKGTAAGILENSYGFQVVRGSDLIQTEAFRRGKRLVTRPEFDDFFRLLLDEPAWKPGFIARAGLNIEYPRVAHDGLRNRTDIDIFAEAGGILIGLERDEMLRFESTRGTHGKYPLDLGDWRAAAARDSSGSNEGSDVPYAMNHADHLITNNGSTAEMAVALGEVLDNYLRP
jgi:hypothetical protein